MVAAPVSFTLPRVIPGAVGRPLTLFPDNTVTGRGSDYAWGAIGPSDALLGERAWTWTPKSAGTASLTLYARDPSGDPDPQSALINATRTVAIADPAAKKNALGRPMIVNPFGDSLFAAAANFYHLQALGGMTGGLCVQCIGSRQTTLDGMTLLPVPYGSPNAVTIAHEGRGGWTIDDYGKAPVSMFRKFWALSCPSLPSPFVTNDDHFPHMLSNNGISAFARDILGQSGGGYTLLLEPAGAVPSGFNFDPSTPLVTPGGAYPDIAFTSSTVRNANPLVNPVTGLMDYGDYLARYSLPVPDVVILGPAANNVKNFTGESQIVAGMASHLSHYDAIVACIRAYSLSLPILVCPARMPPASQDVFAALQAGVYFNREHYKYCAVRFDDLFLQHYDTDEQTSNNVYILPSYLGIDPAILPPTRATIHPPPAAQIMEGEAMYAALCGLP